MVSEFALAPPSLDEVFLALTGHPAEAAGGEADDTTDASDTSEMENEEEAA